MNRAFQSICSWAFIVASLCAIGCASVPAPGAPLSESTRQQIYQRAGQRMPSVALSKPASDSPSNALKLAPLLMLPGEEQMREIHFSVSEAVIHGEKREQRIYSWFVPRRMRGRFKVQAVRITLNSAGEPVIWEILNDSSGADLIWVAQSLEIAAREKLGSALPGRLCAVEPSIIEASNVIVPNVVDDGPTPMGPIIYSVAQGDIAIIACRCSPVYADKLNTEGEYAIRTLSALKHRAFLEQQNVPQGWFDPDRLMRNLRAPSGLLK